MPICGVDSALRTHTHTPTHTHQSGKRRALRSATTYLTVSKLFLTSWTYERLQAAMSQIGYLLASKWKCLRRLGKIISFTVTIFFSWLPCLQRCEVELTWMAHLAKKGHTLPPVLLLAIYTRPLHCTFCLIHSMTWCLFVYCCCWYDNKHHHSHSLAVLWHIKLSQACCPNKSATEKDNDSICRCALDLSDLQPMHLRWWPVLLSQCLLTKVD